MTVYNIWKYTDKIKDITPERLEERLKLMYSNYNKVARIVEKFKHLKGQPEHREKIKDEIKKNHQLNLGIWLSFIELGSKSSGLELSANFKDSVGINHNIKFKNLHFSNRLIQICRWWVGKKIGVYASAIFIDEVMIINLKTGEFIPPVYMSRVEKFLDEITAEIES